MLPLRLLAVLKFAPIILIPSVKSQLRTFHTKTQSTTWVPKKKQTYQTPKALAAHSTCSSAKLAIKK